MATATQEKQPPQESPAPETIEFYREAMDALDEAGVPFLVGGAYAYARYTGIQRHTKDFDVFVRPEDFDRALGAFENRGWPTERTFSHWLGKGFKGDDFVDVIFSSGNGVARVDEQWFEHSEPGEVLGRPVRLMPAEEMIWSKAFIMERERFDGGDVSHIFHCRAADLDWDRLLRRFGDTDGGIDGGTDGDTDGGLDGNNGGWRVLLAHLTLFGYIYPGDAHLIPNHVMETLAERLCQETREPSLENRLCRGPILSRSQYLVDIHRWGYEDARIEPVGSMTLREVEDWTAGIEKDGDTTQLGILTE